MKTQIEKILLNKILVCPPFGWFPSSKYVVDLIIENAQLFPNCRCLDVCAGDGRLAIAARNKGAKVDVIEINPIFQQLLIQLGFNLVGSDFMKTEPRQLSNIIISNPPFSFSPQERGVDLLIIRRAFDLFLAPRGRLVSVVSASHKHSKCPIAQAFRHWMKQTKSQLIELPLEAFWGTERPVTVESWLLVVNK